MFDLHKDLRLAQVELHEESKRKEREWVMGRLLAQRGFEAAAYGRPQRTVNEIRASSKRTS